MKKKHIDHPAVVKKNLKYSTIDGSASASSIGFSSSYLSPYAIFLGASNEQIGLLTAIPELSGRLSELFSSNIIEYFKNRKKVISIFKILQMLMWIPIFLVFLTPQHAVWLLILFYSVEMISGLVVAPIWNSLMGDIVPDKIKGTYFGRRNRIIDFSLLTSMLIAGLLLNHFANLNLIYSFGLIFLISIVGKFVSLIFLNKMHEPDYYVDEKSKFSFIDFIKKMKSTNYGIFVMYFSLLTFSAQIAAPFFSVYMLRQLKFDYLTYTLISTSSVVASFLTFPIWGKHSDRFGNFKVIALTGMLTSLIPLLWLFSINSIYLMFVNAFAGFVWAGFNLASFNFAFDTVSPAKRVRAFSYFHVLVGIAVFFGATLGGYLMSFGSWFSYPIYFVLIISGILRFLVSIIFLPKIREVKKVKKISKGKFLWSIFEEEVNLGLTYPRILIRKRSKIPKRTLEKLIGEIRRFMEWVFKR